MLKKKIIFLLGPTGVGKTAAAISLAKKLKAEIISCDSMQVYRGMDIITSKATMFQRRGVSLGKICPQDPFRKKTQSKLEHSSNGRHREISDIDPPERDSKHEKIQSRRSYFWADFTEKQNRWSRD